MILYRRDSHYLVYIDSDRCWVYDAEADTATRDLDSKKFIVGNNDGWKMIFEDKPIPEGLVKHLIFPFRSK